MQQTGATGPSLINVETVKERYGWRGLRVDLVAGLTVAAVAVPQAMAYALIAGVDPRYGLYTAIVMAALGSLTSSSSQLINGPTNAISLVVLGAIAGLHLKDPAQIREAAFLLAILVGLVQLLIFSLKLGDLTRFVSESVIVGFMLGAGFLIALSQLPNLLGLRAPPNSGEDHILVRLFRTLSAVDAIKPGAVALGLGTVALAILFRQVGRWLKFPFPDLLLALVFASIAAHYAGWKEQWPDFPASLPRFHVPGIEWGWVRGLSGSALAVAVLGLLEALAVAKSIAIQTRQRLDYNWQCLSEGLANLGGGFFQCMPGSGSLTRSSINHQAGAISRVAGLVSAAAVAIAVVLFAGLSRAVPRPALAGILMMTAWRLVDRRRTAYCLRSTVFDRNLVLATAASAVFISIELSILIGVLLSFMFFVPRASRLGATELGLGARNVIHEKAPGESTGRLVVLGLEGELFFGAAPELDQCLEMLRDRVDHGARVIVLRLKRARNPDMVCLDRLQRFMQEMNGRGVPVLLCGVRQDLADAMARLRFQDWLPAEDVFLEVSPGSEGDLIRYQASGKSPPVVSSTLKAIHRAYQILGEDSAVW